MTFYIPFVIIWKFLAGTAPAFPPFGVSSHPFGGATLLRRCVLSPRRGASVFFTLQDIFMITLYHSVIHFVNTFIYDFSIL